MLSERFTTLLRIMRWRWSLSAARKGHLTVNRNLLRHLGLSTCIALMLSLAVTASIRAEPEHAHKAQFLVASSSLLDPMFARTVIVMLSNDEAGALGIIVNRPAPATIAGAFPHMDRAAGRTDALYLGGPVQPGRIFVLLRSGEVPPAAELVVPGVYVSTRQPSFDHVLANNWPAKRFRVLAGYAGWAAGQLQNEIERGDWRLFPVTETALFDVPAEHLWDTLNAQSQGQWALAR